MTVHQTSTYYANVANMCGRYALGIVSSTNPYNIGIMMTDFTSAPPSSDISSSNKIYKSTMRQMMM